VLPDRIFALSRKGRIEKKTANFRLPIIVVITTIIGGGLLDWIGLPTNYYHGCGPTSHKTVSNSIVKSNSAIRLSVLVLVCLATGCMPTGAARLHQEDDIREAVFRYQFEHNASGQQKRAEVYCLSIGENTDPSDEFIRRFAESKSPVRKISECYVGPFVGVVDKRTQRLGLVLRVGGIQWISATEVEASGGYYEAGLSASGDTYSVSNRFFKWRVTEDHMKWISENLGTFPSLSCCEIAVALTCCHPRGRVP
jgi:hypothetical protein